jgi:hypothetical protein
MSTSLVNNQFRSAEKLYKDNKLSEKETLNKLEKITKSATTANDQIMISILEKQKYYEDIRYTKDEMVSLYDKSINSPTELERKEYDERLQVKIKEISFEKLSMIQPDEYETITDRDFELIRDSIYQERAEIAKLCQENREITEYSEKYRLEIINISNTQTQKVKIPAMEEHYFMQILKYESKPTYEYMKKAIKIKLVQYTDNGYFNFLCDRGCVGLFFSTAGYTDFKRIFPFILINEEPCDDETLRNGSKHGDTVEWNAISKAIFGDIK